MSKKRDLADDQIVSLITKTYRKKKGNAAIYFSMEGNEMRGTVEGYSSDIKDLLVSAMYQNDSVRALVMDAVEIILDNMPDVPELPQYNVN